MRRDIGAPDVRYLIVVERPEIDDGARCHACERTAALHRAGRPEELAGYRSRRATLPSQAMQRARQAALPAPEALRANLAERAGRAAVPRRRPSQPFLADVEAARHGSRCSSARQLDGTRLRDEARRAADPAHRRLDGDAAAARRRRCADASPRAIAGAAGQDVILLDLKGESDRLLARLPAGGDHAGAAGRPRHRRRCCS